MRDEPAGDVQKNHDGDHGRRSAPTPGGSLKEAIRWIRGHRLRRDRHAAPPRWRDPARQSVRDANSLENCEKVQVAPGGGAGEQPGFWMKVRHREEEGRRGAGSGARGAGRAGRTRAAGLRHACRGAHRRTARRDRRPHVGRRDPPGPRRPLRAGPPRHHSPRSRRPGAVLVVHVVDDHGTQRFGLSVPLHTCTRSATGAGEWRGAAGT